MMKRLFIISIVFGLLFLGACATAKTSTATAQKGDAPQPGNPERNVSVATAQVVAMRHAQEKTPGAKVLQTAIAMVNAGEIILGSCGDYVNAVYTRAGFTAEKRGNVYLQPETGPYAEPSILKPGDWVMYKNLPYGEIGHSAIFVEWIDFQKRSALTIEYVGNSRSVPGRYREADLTKLWGVVRGKE